MKRLFLILTTVMVSLLATAQSDTALVAKPFIGYLSYGEALRAMPEYAVVQQRLTELRAQYDAELKRVEDEFNQKYEAFLDGQKDFPQTILLKRQTELKELMERNLQFKANSRRELADAEVAAMTPLKERLNAVLADVAQQYGYRLIVNTDADACPYIDPTAGEGINKLVHDALQK